MKKYILLSLLFLSFCVISLIKDLVFILFISSLVAGYCMARAHYKYTRRQRFKTSGIYNFQDR